MTDGTEQVNVEDSDVPHEIHDPLLHAERETPGPAKPTRQEAVEAQLRTVLEWVAVAVGALAVALLIKAFLFQAFSIPSESMYPALTDGNRVLVNRLSYKFGDPGRTDVIVFDKPPNATSTIDKLIKRIIALPGETVSFADGEVFIDGELLEESEYKADDIPTLPLGQIPFCDNEPVADRCTVPEGRVFVMGDNRTGSTDSRRFGPIVEDTIIGRAFINLWPPTDIHSL